MKFFLTVGKFILNRYLNNPGVNTAQLTADAGKLARSTTSPATWIILYLLWELNQKISMLIVLHHGQ